MRGGVLPMYPALVMRGGALPADAREELIAKLQAQAALAELIVDSKSEAHESNVATNRSASRPSTSVEPTRHADVDLRGGFATDSRISPAFQIISSVRGH